ncbi:WYL domain-containing protein [uncultured Polaribacter sp.]|uniref:WYL domain-containing protein n=1 Tax=uncultured Polaribacter sp. TaxID=174711 RepID=UPI002622D5B9|nr:WYL domain-containing protein [uncultured Polaribacter sp.]
MKSLERINLLYKHLKKHTANLEELLIYLKTQKYIISKRQLQRDISKLNYFLKTGEQLVKDRDVTNSLLLRIYTIKQDTALEKPIDLSTFDTGFSNVKDQEDNSIREDFTTLILNATPIKITDIQNDVTSENYNFETRPLYFLPLQFINHRFNIYIGGYNIKQKTYQIFELSQLKRYHKIKNKKTYEIHRLQSEFKNELAKRFGITKNINEEVYEIKLAFSLVTGAYIRKRHWHHSQLFSRKEDRLEMSLTCGINRELLSWLHSWIYNVKVLEPPVLVDYFKKSIKEVETLNNKKIPLVYKNIFVSKI